MEHNAKLKNALKVGILSTANIAGIEIKALHNCPLTIAYAVASRSLEKAQEYAKANNLQKAYGSYGELVDDPEIDAVYIPLPTSLHKEWTLKCAAKGKHILCEKPLAAHHSDVVEMIEACKKANVLFMDGVMWSHHKRTAAVFEDVYKHNVIGKVLRVNSTFNAKQKESDIRHDPKLEPLGSLGDLGWYNIRGCLFGYDHELPEKVFGISMTGSQGQILTFVGQLWYKDGRSAQFTCSFTTYFFQSLELHGSDGYIVIPNFVWPHDDKLTYEIVHRVDSKRTVEIKTVPEGVTPYNNYHLIETFAKLVLEIKEGKPRNTYWEQLALTNQKILDALLQSSLEKREVTLS